MTPQMSGSFHRSMTNETGGGARIRLVMLWRAYEDLGSVWVGHREQRC
jgi:hypothetical protein